MWSISSSSLDIDLRWCSRGETCLLYENLSLRKGNLSLKSAGSAILDCFFLASSEDVMNIFYPLAWLASSDAFGPNWSYNSVSSWSFFLSYFSMFLQISRRKNSAWLALSPFKSTFSHFCFRTIISPWNLSTFRSFSTAQNHALESKNMDLIFCKLKKTQKTWI